MPSAFQKWLRAGLLAVLAASLFLPGSAGAQQTGRGGSPGGSKEACVWGKFEVGFPYLNITGVTICEWAAQNSGSGQFGAVGSAIQKIVNAVAALTVMVAIISIVLGGYLYMTAGGNASQVQKAKILIGAALLGVILALMGWAIIALINPAAS